ncbi:ribosome biogenesis protein SLX9-domain-containing protein [Crucibulum laeve]|uniref:Ribosome biogenesis protein SLX9 n=1 Tax=Crucibulum laeve TaxID=68775 RepID=A0A5C3M870_9AGAR|nr:ribosome biogenesis protein SLX9-domain-containing protein [Crucibulum laeve]
MPKERRKRIGAHEPSVKLNKRTFASQQNTVQYVEVGAAMNDSPADIFHSMGDVATISLSKKQKQQLKREALLQKLEGSKSPYSKSHNRRLKRKANEQIAGGLDDIQAVITALDDTAPSQPSDEHAQSDSMTTEGEKAKANPKIGKIGEGKGVPLSKRQRKRALQLERVRHPLILTNSHFSSNPFETIRLHAQNTLLKH